MKYLVMITGLKRFLLLLMTLASCWSVCLYQGKMLVPPSDSKDRKELSSPEGRFSVLLPGTPVTKPDEFQTSAGKVIAYVFTLKLAEAFYYISYLDYPTFTEGDEFVKKVLDAGRDGMLARNRGMQLLAERQVSLGDFPGREFLLLEDHSSFGISRTFVIRGRLYEVAIFFPAAVAFKSGRVSIREQDRMESFNSIATRFFDSFKLIDATESLGEVERVLRELKGQHKGVVTMVGSAADPSDPNLIRGGVIN